MANIESNKVHQPEFLPSDSCELLEDSLNVELNPSDYITSVPISPKTAKETSDSLAKLRETTRSKLAIRLTKIFSFSLGASFLLILITSFNPKVDKANIKDLISVAIAPQVTLLSFALGFYFGSNNRDN